MQGVVGNKIGVCKLQLAGQVQTCILYVLFVIAFVAKRAG